MGGRGVKTAFQGRAKQILIRIADNSGNIHTNQIVDRLGVIRNSVCQYLAKHREEGFITSARSGNDKRFVYHSLTARGREFLDGLSTGPRSDPVRDLTSQGERQAELTGRQARKEKELEENLDGLLDDSEDFASEEEKELDFDNNDMLTF